MSTRVFDLEGRVGLQDKDFLSKVKRIREANKSLKREMQIQAGTLKPTKEYQALEKQIRASEKALEDLNKEKAKQAKAHTRSDEYKALQKDIASAEAELDGLIEKQISMADLPHGAYFQQLDDQIEQARVKLEEMKASLAAIAETGATDKEAQDWYRTADAIDRAEDEVRRYKAQRAQMESSGAAYEKTGPSAFKRIRTAIASAAKQLLKMTPLQKRVANGFSNIGKQANKMKRGLMMGAGVRGLVRLGAAGAIALYSVRMLKQGMENLVNYDATTMNSLNMLKASLDTLRNALATAFAPIFNAIAPALNTLINMLSKAATAVAHFMAAITGQKSVVVAKKAVSGYSGAAAGAAKNSKKANKAAKEYQSTLLGFDQINKLESNKGSDPASGGGGAGAGAGGGGAGGMFETVPVDNQVSQFVDRLKKAWEKADFYWLGALLANKLNNALESIPWDKIKKTASKIGKSIATFLNGFIETANWKLVGKTLAEGINTAFEFLYSFVTNFHFASLGKAIANLVTGFFGNIDYGKIAATIGHALAGALELLGGFIMNVNWKDLPWAIFKGIGNAIKSIPYARIAKAIFTLLGAAVGAAAGLAVGIGKAVVKAVGNAFKGIGKYFKKSIQKESGNIPKGILAGIVNGIKGIGSWIKKNIFKPFIKGFKKAFGISSPSKQMAKQGKYIMDGLLKGAKDNLKNLLKWFKDLPGKLIEKVGNITVNITGKIGDVAGEIKDKAIDMVANFTSWVKGTSFGSTIGSMVAKFTEWLKDFNVGTIGGWVAEFGSKVIKSGVSFAGTVGGWIAEFGSKVIKSGVSFAGTVGGWVANFTEKAVSLAWSAKKTIGNGGKWVEGFVAKFTNKAFGFVWKSKKTLGKGGKWVEGFVAKFNKRYMALSWRAKRLVNQGGKWVEGFVSKFTQKYLTKNSIGLGTKAKRTIDGFVAYFTESKYKGGIFKHHKAGGGVYSGGHWVPIQRYAEGGAPNRGQVFVAREAGPELVGTLGGYTAVMNNDQIVASVSAGVAKAVAAVLGGQSQDVNIYLQGDAGQIFKVVRKEAKNYTMSTGLSAFPV